MTKKTAIRNFEFYQLEDRVLLNAECVDVMPQNVDSLDLLQFEECHPLIADSSLFPDAQSTHSQAAHVEANAQKREEQVSSELSENGSVELGADQSTNGSDPLTARREVIFVDAGVTDVDSLLNGIRDSNPGIQWTIVQLTADRNGIEQISESLGSLTSVDAIHLVSHGDGSSLRLGNSLLNLDSATGEAGQLALWANSLNEDADILIYGCDLASTDDGRALIDSLSALTGADVAASDDLTGHSDLGGDWELEYQYGVIESQVFATSTHQELWYQVLATFTVTNSNDSGTGSLRQAILDANALGGLDTIEFAISGTGVHTINVGSSMTITEAVTINATTDDSFATNSNRPAIVLDGNNSFTGDGFVLTGTADGTTIRGFVIRDFTGDGIEIQANSNGNTIAGNYIGRLDATGIDSAGNANTGVGIRILGANNTIGGTSSLDRNLISGNQSHGIYMSGSSATNNTVLGNYIGTTITGLVDLGNSLNGIFIDASASNNTIGGLNTASRNVVSGNDNAGIAIDNAGTTGNLIIGNYIGIGSDGSTALGNTHNGVHFNTSGANTLGSIDSNGRNVISSNAIHGIGVDNATNVTILGNYIGTDATGTLARGNAGDGIRVSGAASGIMIGGTATGSGNLIANNSGDGVAVTSSSTSAATIIGNSIFNNTESGIDLGADDIPTANDLGDGDTGSNALQNTPSLTGAFTNASNIVAIAGSLNSTATTTFRIEFYSNTSGDEGQNYLGHQFVTTNSSGNVQFVERFSASATVGATITATATNLATGATSEFSASRATIAALIVDTFSDIVDGTVTSVAALLAARGADGRISLREAVRASNGSGGSQGIILGAGTYTLAIAGGGEDSSVTGDLDAQANLTIIGAGASSSIIHAGGVERAFEVDGSGNLSLVDVRLTGGSVANDGGGLLVELSTGTATLNRVEVTGNAITGGNRVGGGIHNVGTLYINNSWIHSNTATGSDGGGISNISTATITNSSIYSNTGRDGAGIFQSAGTFLVQNTTISGNTASATGGGVELTGGTMSIVYSTIASNTASAGSGGGVFRSAGTLSLTSSIFADNSSTTGGRDVNGTFSSGGFNIIEHNSGFTGSIASDQLGSDAGLSALAADATSGQYVHALNTGSIAINTGGGTAPPVDQRGFIRVNTADVGAFEANIAPVLADTVLSISTTEDSGVPSGAVGSLISALTSGITDSDRNPVKGIAITATNESYGTWYYSTNGGTNWSTVGVVSAAASLLLADDGNTRLYFAPAANFYGSVTSALTLRAWDRTSGTAGNKVNTSTNGGITPYSSASDVISVTVSGTNDAPSGLFGVPKITNANILGYYSFDAISQLGRDDAGDSAPITLNGSPTPTTRPSGATALDLAGGTTYQHGNITGLTTTGGAMTIAGWTKFDSTGSWERVFDFGQASSGGIGNIYVGREGSTSNLTFTIEKFGVYTYRATALNAITNGTWLHFAATVDASGNMSLYVNGALADTETGVALEVGVRTNHYVGRSNWGADPDMDGAIDDLLIANGVLNAADIAELYQQTIGFTVAENAANTTVIGTMLTSDPDAGNTYTYTLTNNAGGRFAIDLTTGQITVANSSLLDFESAASHSITVRVTDQGNLTYDEIVTISLTNIEEASTASIPTSLVATEDTNLVFSTANGNAITVADPDGTPQRVTISVPTGTLTLSTVSGLTFTAGDGTADSLMTFSGTIANINAALNGLAYIPTANYNGAASIRVVSGDAAQSTALDTDANLLIRYSFDNSSQLNDDTATTANGTIAGAVSATDSTRGNVASFDGVDDVITTASFNTPANFSIGIWAKSDTSTWNSTGMLLSKRDSFVLHPNASTTSITMYVRNTSSAWTTATIDLSTIANFSLTDWHHYGATFDGTTVKLFIDGVERASAAFSGTLLGDNGPMTIGQDDGQAGRFFDGNLDDARVYSRALSAGEFATLAANTSAVREQTFSIASVNDAPVIAGLDGDSRSFTEDSPAIVIGSATGISDIDSTDFNTGTLTVSFTAGSDSTEDVLGIRNEGSGAGQIGVSGSNITYGGVTIGTFTGGSSGANLVITLNANADATSTTALINNLTYLNTDNDNPTTTTRNIRVVLTDGDGGTSVNNATTMTVTAVNDAPTLGYTGTIGMPSTNEDTTSSATLVSDILISGVRGDVDSPALSGIAVTSISASGTFQYSTDGTTWTDFGSVSGSSSLLLTSSSRVRFIPNGNNGESATFTYRAWDQTSGTASINGTPGYADSTTNGGSTAYSSQAGTVQCFVTSVNDAPVLDNSGAMTFTTITEDQTTNSGNTVASIISSASGDRITDTDASAVEGIAITATTNGNGTWQYSTNGGSTWTAVGSVSNTSALLLRDTDLVRFVPNGQNATTGDFTFRAWDQTSGTFGTKVDTSTNGNTTAFSAATEVASITVTAVNDAPVLDNTGSMGLGTISENNSTSSDVASIIVGAGGNRITDVDSGAIEGLAITSYTMGPGTWRYSTDSGATWVDFGTVSESSALLLRATDRISYTGNGLNGGSADFIFRAWDQTSGTAGTKVDASTNGGTTAFSTATEQVTVTTTSVNDAPTINNGTNINLTATDEDTPSSASTVASLLGDVGLAYADVDAAAVQGLAVTATTGLGTWQYSTDGNTWVNISGVSSTNALLLNSSTQLRFNPGGQNGSSPTLAFRAWDQSTGTASTNGVPSFANPGAGGGSSAFSSSSANLLLTVTSVNDAPVLDNGGNLTLTTINEDAVNNTGHTVAAILASDSGTPISDVDTVALQGIAITSLNTGFGKWQYSLDGGTNWLDVGTVTNASALLLRSTDSIRFLPQFENGSNPDFTFRAWDQTSGTAGTKVSTTSNGGTTAFSTATETASILVTDVNDAPVLDSTRTPAFNAINEDAGMVQSVASLIDFVLPSGQVDNASDNDIGAVLGIAITGANSTYGTWSYSIDNGTNWLSLGAVSDSNARLLIANSTTLLYFAPNANYHGTISDAITFRAWDQTSGSNGALADTSTNGGTTAFSIATDVAALTINPVNDAPISVTDTATAVEAGGTANGTAGTHPTGNVLTNDTDIDAGDTKAVTGVSAGVQALAAGSVASPVNGTYGSINIAADGSYTYTVDNSNTAVQALRTSSNTLQDVFTYTMRDTAGLISTTQITVTIQGANDAPVDLASTALAVNENVTSGASVGTVTGQDVDSGESFTYTLTNDAGGRFTINNAGQITVADGSLLNFEANASHMVTVRVMDAAGAFYDEAFNISVNDVNEAPVLDNSGPTALSTITEDQTNNNGQTVAAIIASAGGNRITDVDAGAVEGIAITSLSSGNGTWQYSLDGTTWVDVGTVTNNSALLLRSSDSIRFVPNALNATTADFTFRAWDQTTGSAGNNVNTSTNGGATAFSTATEVASITVTAVNDAPTITDSSVVTLTGTDEDTVSPTQTVSSLLTSVSWADVDIGALQGIAITSTTGNGNWQYFAGGSWTSFGAPSANGSLLLSSSTLIRYQPDGLNAETAIFSFRAWDQSTGTASTSGTPVYGDSTSNGGTTAYSSQAASAQLAVSAVNDAAVANSDAGLGDEAGGYANATPGSNPSGNVLSNDTDVDTGDSFSVTGVASGVVASASGNVASSVTGTYGAIQIAADGNYTYTINNNNPIVQALRTSGQTLTDTFTYTIQDTGGAFSSTQIVITIRGTNDAPVADVDNPIAIEAGGYANGTSGTNPTGNVLSNDIDVDAGDTKTVTGVVAGVQALAAGPVSSPVTGTYGSITIASTGAYTYTVNNNDAAVQALRNSSNTLLDVFSYTMVDAAGLSSTTQVTVTIQGANDAPGAVDDSAVATEAGGVSNGTTGNNPSGNVLTNDTDIDSGDTKSVIGVVAGTAASASGSVGVGLSGSYGSILVAADGSYTYAVDNNNAAVQALRLTANTLTERFTYTMTDAGGLTSTATLTITIEGSNDNPVAVANTATATEAGGINNNLSGHDPSGNVLTNDTDVDAGDTKTVTGVAAGVQPSATGSVGATVGGTYGSIVINADGTYTYTLNNNNATVEALNDGQSISETFTYTMRDTTGATSTSTIVITIEGADDLPFAVVDYGTSEEAGGLNNAVPGSTPTGNVFTNDVAPNGNTLTGVEAGVQGSASGNVNQAVDGLYGSISIDAAGNYSYTLDNNLSAVEALRTSADQLTDVFTYTFLDSLGYSSSTQVTITIEGKNDSPISADDLSIAVESAGLNNTLAGSNATGNVLTNDTDVDAGDTKSVIGIVAGTVTTATGNVGASINGTYGSIVLSHDGSFTYVINENNTVVQALRMSGQTVSDLFTYTIEDTEGATSTATLTITIDGRNDRPLAVTDSITATESGGVNNGSLGTNPSGNVLTNDTDVDSVANGETKTVTGVASGTQTSTSGNVASSVAGTYGSIAIAADGTFTYTVNNNDAAIQALRTSGNTLQDIFTYTVTDAGGLSSSTQVTVTIQGSNDTPTVASDSAQAIEAGGTANATSGSNPTGNVLSNDSDVDAADTLLVSGVSTGTPPSANGSVGSAVAGAYGSLTIASDGSYTYVVNNSNLSVQALRTNSDTLTDVFTYTAQDSSGATATTQITLTIRGRNDAPVGFADNDIALEAGGTNNGSVGSGASGNVISNDLEYDSGDTTSVSGVASGIQASTSGSIGVAIAGLYGSITLNADGSYSYSVNENNAAVQALRLSTQTLDEVFSYTIVDAAGLSSTTQLTITIRGANDAPVAVNDNNIAVESGGTNNATAGSAATGNVLTNDTDVDAGDTKTVSGISAGVQALAAGPVSSPISGTFGSITIAADGSYTYTVDNSNGSVQALRTPSDTLQDVFTYTVIDNAGLSSTTQITITIQGTNDAPVAVSDVATAVEAGGTANGNSGTNPNGNVLTNDTDVDAGDSKSVVGVAAGSSGTPLTHVGATITGLYGSLVLGADGTYTYTVNQSNATVQALAVGGTLVDTFTYTVGDTLGAISSTQLAVTIQGANDASVAATIEPAPVAYTENDGSIAITSSLTLADVDDSHLESAVVQITSQYVTGEDLLSFTNQNGISGSWNASTGTLTLTGQATVAQYQAALRSITYSNLSEQPNTATRTVSFTVNDGNLNSNTQSRDIAITTVNDAPVVSIESGDDDSSSLNETNAGLTSAGTLTVTDVDTTDIVTAQVSSVVASGTTTGLLSNNAALLTMLSVTANVIDNANTIGTITWDFDSAAEAFNYLAAGEALTLTYAITATDNQGATDTHQVTITVTGTNDAPIITVGGSDSAAETLSVTGSTLTTGGSLSVADIDRTDIVTAAVTNFAKAGDLTGLMLNDTQLEALLALNANVISNTQQTGTVNWTFDSAGYAFNYLGAGQSITLTYTITTTDSQGVTDTQDVVIAINGNNSAPNITVEVGDSSTDGLTETNTTLTSSGTLSVLDINTTDTVTAQISTVAASGTTTGLLSNNAALLNMLSVNANVINNTSETGTITWAFHSGSEAFNYLATGETLTLTYTITATDNQGASDTQQVTITVTGTNDDPLIIVGGSDSAAETLSVTGSTLTTGGSLSVADIDRTDIVTAAVTNFAKAGDMTGLTLNDTQLEALLALNANVISNTQQTGIVNWTFDSAGYAFNYLGAGQSITLTYTVTTTDSQGATDTQDVVIAINGNNSAPNITVEVGDSAADGLTETNTTLTSGGTLSVLDINTTDTVAAQVSTVAASGTTTGLLSNNAALLNMLSVNANVINNTSETGTITWAFNSGSEAFNYLATGETLTLTYTITATDSQGASDTQQVTITVTGTNDDPLITVGGSDSAAETLSVTGSTLTTGGSLSVADIDRTDIVTAAVTSFAKAGDLTGLMLNDTQLEALLAINSNVISNTQQTGIVNWTFDSAGYAFNYLGAGQSITLTYTITTTDSQGATDTQDVVIAINGNNSAPNITVEVGDSSTDGLTETNTTLTSGGTLSVLDINTTDTVTAQVSSVAASGTTTGLLSNNAALLNMLSVNTNVINNTSTTGTITWAFHSGSEAFNYLATGETLTLTYTITATDSQGASDTQQVTITVTGTNDDPLITIGGSDSTAETLSVTGSTLTTGGSLSVADIDRTDIVTAAVTNFAKAGDLTGLTLNDTQLEALLALNANVISNTQQTGTVNWTFDSAGYAFNYLGAGQSITLTYTITTTDSQGATDTQGVVITINGNNSAPNITVESGDSAADGLTETSTTLTSGGTLSVLDINTTDTVTAQVSSVAASGATTGLLSNNAALLNMLSVNTNVINNTSTTGTITWAFNSGSEAFNYLATGETLTLTYTITATDNQGASDTQQVTITVTGTNDDPLITVGGSDSAAETLSVTGSTLTSAGSLSVADIDRTDVVTAQVSNFAKSGDLTGLTLSDSQLQAMLALNANVISNTQQTGTINWAFDSNGYAFSYLGAGQSITLTYTVTVTDTQGAIDTQNVTVTIHGTNSAPNITVESGDSSSSGLTETNSSLSSAGTLSVLDVNTTDIVTAQVSSVLASGATNGLLSNNAALLNMLSVNGNVINSTSTTGTITWSFNSSGETFDYLAAGETLTLTYTITATDSQGASDTQTIILTITGSNDLPVIALSGGDSDADTVYVTGSTLTSAGSLSVDDIDLSDVVTAQVSAIAKSGDIVGLTLSDPQLQALLSLNTNVISDTQQSGTIHWAFNSGGYTFGYLGAGQSITLTYTITVTDSQAVTDTRDISITIQDRDDFDVTTPTDSDATANQVNENVAIGTTVGITANAFDSDVTNNAITYSLTGNADNLFQVNANTGVVTTATAIDREVHGSTRTITVQALSSDGSYTSQTYTITINDLNDNAPVIGVGQSFSLAEGLPLGSAVGFVLAADLDITGSLQNWSILSDSSTGGFSIDPTTSQITTNRVFDYEQGTTYSLTVRVSDGIQSSAIQTITVLIADANEGPTAIGESYTIRTDQIVSVLSPGLTANDLDPDGDTLFPVLITGPAYGVLTMSANGQFTYDPNPGFFGIDTFVYRVSDGSQLSNLATVTIQVDAAPAIITPIDPVVTSDPDPITAPINEEAPEQETSLPEEAPTNSPVTTSSEQAPVNMAEPGEGARKNLGFGHVASRDELSESEPARENTTKFASSRSNIGRQNIGEHSVRSRAEMVMMQNLLHEDLRQAIVWNRWNELKGESATTTSLGPIDVGTAGVTAGLVSVGYVMWALRGGMLLATVYSSLPAWRLLDPASLLIDYRGKKASEAADSVETFLGG